MLLDLFKVILIIPIMFVALVYFFIPYLYMVLWKVDDMLRIPPHMYLISFMGLIGLTLLMQYNAG